MLKCKKILVGISACFIALGLSTVPLSANEQSVVTINATNVNLRSAANTSCKVVGLLQKDNKLTVLLQEGNWYKVSTSNNIIGWVKSDFISSTNSTASPASTSSPLSSGTVNTSNVNLRSAANTSCKVIGQLAKGDKLKIVTQDGDWLNVSTINNKIGWVHKDFVSLTQNLTSRDGNRVLASRSDTTRASSVSESIVNYAKQFQGVKYVWGGNTPNGFDCSGFVKYVYQKSGITLNRVAADQAKQGTQVSKADLSPGNLVFFDTDGGHNYINHVGIYIGSGMFIHASSGAGKVVITSLTEGFYANTYMTARKFF